MHIEEKPVRCDRCCVSAEFEKLALVTSRRGLGVYGSGPNCWLCPVCRWADFYGPHWFRFVGRKEPEPARADCRHRLLGSLHRRFVELRDTLATVDEGDLEFFEMLEQLRDFQLAIEYVERDEPLPEFLSDLAVDRADG